MFEGKNFWHFDDRWADSGSGLVLPYEKAADRTDLFVVARYFRLAFREVASSTNERTSVFALLPPNAVTVHTAPSEQHPDRRPNSTALGFAALVNSFVFDFAARINATGHMSLFILERLPLPKPGRIPRSFLSHSALRLTCSRPEYEALWREQLGTAWREPGVPPLTWPVLADEDERWGVRAAIDAVVADAYDLSRQQYQHVLSTFSHSSYLQAPQLCLKAFDELTSIGLEAFVKKHDPYWNIAVNEKMPETVIDLPQISRGAASAEPGLWGANDQGADGDGNAQSPPARQRSKSIRRNARRK